MLNQGPPVHVILANVRERHKPLERIFFVFSQYCNFNLCFLFMIFLLPSLHILPGWGGGTAPWNVMKNKI